MKKISTNSLSLQWKLDALLSLTEMEHKTHNPLLKPFTFCTIFAWFGIYKGFPDWVITPLLTLFACWPVSSVKYCKCYLFLDDSPRSSSCQISFNTPTTSSTHCFTPAVDDFKTCIVHSLKSCPVRYTQTLPAGCHPPDDNTGSFRYGRPFVSIFAKSNSLSLNLIRCR